MTPPTQICCVCAQGKPLEDYHRDRKKKNGHSARCKECHRAYLQEWRRRNSSTLKTYDTVYRAVNRDRIRQNQNRYYARNKSAIKVKQRLREPLRRGGREPGSIEYVAIIEHDPCAYCGHPSEHIDHITPIAGGGNSSWTNLTASCAACNHSKNATPMLAWMAGKAKHKDTLILMGEATVGATNGETQENNNDPSENTRLRN